METPEKKPKKIAYSAAHRPGLAAGAYTLTITPSLVVKKDNKKNELPPAISQDFAVTGERFNLKPAHVRAVFPPEGSIGDHSNVLPHIILDRSTLPWERKANPEDPDDQSLPWLALLLFDEDAGEVPEPKILTVAQLQHPDPNAPTGDGAGKQGPAGAFPRIVDRKDKTDAAPGILKLEPGQRTDEKVTVIDVKTSVLARILPAGEDLKWMAHVRQVVVEENKEEDNEMAVILSNRLPKRGGRSVVHLVSLENHFGPKGFYTSLSKDAPDSEIIRFISLKSWSFSCLEAYKISATSIEALQKNTDIPVATLTQLLSIGEVTGTTAFLDQVKAVIGDNNVKKYRQEILDAAVHETFQGLLLHLNRHPSTLRLPAPDHLPASGVPFLAMGATALPHSFRNGDRLVSWYHGPLAPAVPAIRFRGPAELQPSSLNDPEALVARLNNPGNDQLAAFLKQKLAPDVVKNIGETGVLGKAGFVEALIQDLNYLLKTEKLYDTSRFPQPLPGPLQELVNQDPGGEMLLLLNRLLLTFAWPDAIAPITFRFPVMTADELLIYQPQIGMFDASYAAAWELGRLMALRDKKLSVALFNLKRSQHQRTKMNKGPVLTHLPFQSLRLNTDAAVPADITSWFERLGQLENIPFNYLVADERMLPPESIRFFRIDTWWRDSLFDGAFSIGRVSASHLEQDAGLRKALDTGKDQPLSGFLLRSDLVTGWPDLQIEAYTQLIKDDNNVDEALKVKPVRTERLSNSILLCLFSVEVKTVDIHQKPEQLHFGLDQLEAGDFEKVLKDSQGKELQDAGGKPVVLAVRNDASKKLYYFREEAERVMNIDALSGQIKQLLASNKQSLAVYTSAEFGVQMIEGANRVRFRISEG